MTSTLAKDYEFYKAMNQFAPDNAEYKEKAEFLREERLNELLSENEELQDKIDELESELEEVDKLQEKVDELESENEELQNEINKLKSDMLDALQAKIDKLAEG
jgi:predicted nuclease with TOPRIM domain